MTKLCQRRMCGAIQASSLWDISLISFIEVGGQLFTQPLSFLRGRCWLFVFTPMCSCGGEWIPTQSKNDSISFVNKIDGERVRPTSGTRCVYFLEADKKTAGCRDASCVSLEGLQPCMQMTAVFAFCIFWCHFLPANGEINSGSIYNHC